MTPKVRPFVRFCGWLLGLLAAARNPLSVIPLLLLRGIDRRVDFRVGRLILSARRADLVAISEMAIDNEYEFVKQLTLPGSSALVLDLGANIGCFSALVFSTSADAEVHSVEPSPDTFALLSGNRARYPALRWHTHQLAIAAESGIVQFHNEGPSTARKLAPVTAGGVIVETEAFDSFVTRVARSRRVFLCKMDIEGAEVPIFSGAMNTLAQIDHFVVEVHGPAANAALVTDRLSATFPHVQAIEGRRSSKPMIHAWRADAVEYRHAGAATR
jgi:FkbM family methyltransferase